MTKGDLQNKNSVTQKKLALVGNPNSGKTTMYNALTGSTQYVGNWPGVTVEKKEGYLKGYKNLIVTDLPGIYSLSPYTLEEVITRNYLINDRPSAIINIVDATNLERNLYLTTQLVEMGIPVIIALNMMDIVDKRGDKIDTDLLAKCMGCKVVEMSALKSKGIHEAAKTAANVSEGRYEYKSSYHFNEDVENALIEIFKLVMDKKQITTQLVRWYSIKLFERDSKVLEELEITDGSSVRNQIEAIIKGIEARYDDDSESIITNERYNIVTSITKKCLIKKNKTNVTMSDKIDKIVTNRFLAIPIFVAVMFLIYFIAMGTIGAFMTDWVNDSLFGEIVPEAVTGWLETAGAADWLQSLLVDGIIGGVGAVLGFLPQLAVLFLLLAILEDCGYMARIAFILDQIFRKFGLSGKSFIPIMIGTGCSVPGIMASRTIDNESQRKMTIITTSFMPCGAKIPIIGLIAGALFNDSWLIAGSAYLIGIAAIMLSGIILKKFRGFTETDTPFVMELPAYHVPSAKTVLIHTWDRTKAFVIKAGTIIFVACVFIWFLSNFNYKFQMVEESESILAAVGNFIAPIFKPLGWGDWRAAVATITGLIAKENVVGTFGVLFGNPEVSEMGEEIWVTIKDAFTPLAAYSFLLFNLLCAPCFAAIGAIRREMNSFKWTAFAIAYQTILAYLVALAVYQIGMLIQGTFGIGTVFGIAAVLLLVFMIVRRDPRKKQLRLITAS